MKLNDFNKLILETNLLLADDSVGDLFYRFVIAKAVMRDLMVALKSTILERDNFRQKLDDRTNELARIKKLVLELQDDKS